jgi:hypothetical protein
MRKERGPNWFLKREVARAIRAAKEAGGQSVEIDPATGRIRVILGDQNGAAANAEHNEWDKELYGTGKTEVR